jgi:hypothetical protein
MIGRLHALLRPLVSGAFWRATIAARQARRFDRRHGTDTVQRLPVAAMRDVPDALARHAVHYEPSAMPKLRRALRVVVRELGARLPDYAFVDVGSGKGLVVMLASRHPFKEIVGVEMAPELHAVAGANLARFGAGRRAVPVRLVQGDALRLELPSGPLVVYLYNPFDATVLAPFLERLVGAAAARDVVIVYVNPQHAQLLDDAARFEPLFQDAHLRVYRCRRNRGVASPA